MFKNDQRLKMLLDVYYYMVLSQSADMMEADLVSCGEANFLASSRGHEGSAILAPFLIKSDYLHCHYRDKALMLHRGISVDMFFYSALAKQESHSSGRQMVSHMSAAEHNILSLVGPVGNNALQAAGIASVIKNDSDNPIVICCLGDGTTQQGEVLEAIAEAKRNSLPVLFFIHDNGFAISTRTHGKTFFSQNGEIDDEVKPSEFYGIKISYLDGTKPFTCCDEIADIVAKMRVFRQSHIIVFGVNRLDNHSNADDQNLYRTTADISDSHVNFDPIKNSYQYLIDLGIDECELNNIQQRATQAVAMSVNTARMGKDPVTIYDAAVDLPDHLKNIAEYRGSNDSKRLTMLEAMRSVFDLHLGANPNVYLLGEDIEDGKGDVFGITRGLSTKYPGRVNNSALSESTIMGLATGMALAGKKPVAFIQFADFMPLAYNQIVSEIATMYWRTNGSWNTPVLIFAACGGYRPGLGPFHSQTNEAPYAHAPGLDIFMPSNAADAAGMLNLALLSPRPSMFLYPKKLLNNSSLEDTVSCDIEKIMVPLSKALVISQGHNITLVGWGNTVSLCMTVAKTLELNGYLAEVIDLRTVKPYDLQTITNSVRKTGKLLVTFEDSIVCSVGSDIVASVVEQLNGNVRCKRVSRGDTYVPCNYANQLDILPSYERILIAACELMDLEVSFEDEGDGNNDPFLHKVDVIGASPSDESVLISKLQVQVGSHVSLGDVLVDIEASKSSGEILSPVDGVIESIMVTESQKALVGSELLTIRMSTITNINNTNKVAKQRRAIIKDKNNLSQQLSNSKGIVHDVGISVPHFIAGSKCVTNDELLINFPDYISHDIEKRTGITKRYWLSENESLVDLSVEVAKKALTYDSVHLSEINLIVCATTTPEKYQSPSQACLVLSKLYETYGVQDTIAYDINAACSGYIYALQVAYDYLATRPNARVLLITAEALSRRIDVHDFETAFLFGDGVSATIVNGANHVNKSVARIDEIYLASLAENGDILNIPTDPSLFIDLQGKKLFAVAVKNMARAVTQCAKMANITPQDIDLLIPHQANQRILDAVGARIGINGNAVYSNISNYGNTSSCTIPSALSDALQHVKSNQVIGLCAFGGGFTMGAAILKKI